MSVPVELNRAGWRWTTAGVEITVSGRDWSRTVLIPLRDVQVIFNRELAAVGDGLPASVGSTRSCDGWLTAVGSTAKQRRKSRNKGKRKGFFKALGNAVKKVGNVAKKVVTHPAFRAGFAALSTAFPVLAPAAAGLEVASRVIQKIEKGKAAAKQIAAGLKKPSKAAQNQVLEAARAKGGIKQLDALARQGNKQAQRALGSLVTAQSLIGSP